MRWQTKLEIVMKVVLSLPLSPLLSGQCVRLCRRERERERAAAAAQFTLTLGNFSFLVLVMSTRAERRPETFLVLCQPLLSGKKQGKVGKIETKKKKHDNNPTDRLAKSKRQKRITRYEEESRLSLSLSLFLSFFLSYLDDDSSYSRV